MHYPRSAGEFQSWFATDEDCLDYLAWLRWPKGFVCPRCEDLGGWVVADAGTIAKSGQSLRMARSAVRLQAHIRSAAAMLVAPLIRRRPIAVFRSVAITRGAFPVLMVDASSR